MAETSTAPTYAEALTRNAWGQLTALLADDVTFHSPFSLWQGRSTVSQAHRARMGAFTRLVVRSALTEADRSTLKWTAQCGGERVEGCELLLSGAQICSVDVYLRPAGVLPVVHAAMTVPWPRRPRHDPTTASTSEHRRALRVDLQVQSPVGYQAQQRAQVSGIGGLTSGVVEGQDPGADVGEEPQCDGTCLACPRHSTTSSGCTRARAAAKTRPPTDFIATSNPGSLSPRLSVVCAPGARSRETRAGNPTSAVTSAPADTRELRHDVAHPTARAGQQQQPPADERAGRAQQPERGESNQR